MGRNFFLALVEVANVLSDVACGNGSLWWPMVGQHVNIVWRQSDLCAGGGERVAETMRTGKMRHLLAIDLALLLGFFDVATFALCRKHPWAGGKQNLILPSAVPK
jgi:hypothetical protein